MELQYYAENNDYCFLCIQCSSETTLVPAHGSELPSCIQVNIRTPWLCVQCVDVLHSFEKFMNRARRAQTLLFNIINTSQLQREFVTNKDYLIKELNEIKSNTLDDKVTPSTEYTSNNVNINYGDIKEEHEGEVDMEGVPDEQDQKIIVPAMFDLKTEDNDTNSNDFEEDKSISKELIALLAEHNYASQVTTYQHHSIDQNTTHQHQQQTRRTTHVSESEANIRTYNRKPAKTAQITKSYQRRPPGNSTVYQLHPADQSTNYQQIQIQSAERKATVSTATPGPSLESSRVIICDTDTDTDLFIGPKDSFIPKLASLVFDKIAKKELTEDEVLERMQQTRQSKEFIHAKHKCEPCALVFSAEWLRLHHMKLHEKKKAQYCCKFCLLSYETKKRFNNHRAKHLTIDVCLICNEESYYNGRYSLLDHYFLQHTLTYLHCKQCGKVERKPLSLESHMKIHRTEECPECKLTVPKTQMFAHMQFSHRYEFENGVPCTICKKKFKNFVKRDKHIKTTHTDSKKKKKIIKEAKECYICHKKYTYLERHLRDQHESEGKISDKVNNIVSCPVCNAILRNYASLKSHIQFVHEKERSHRFTCDDCGKTFHRKFEMKIHICKDHLKKNMFKCLECGKMFFKLHERRKHRLKEHGKGFQTVKNLVCDICGKECTSVQILKNHTLIHTGEKPHICKQCGRAFRRRPSLTLHTKLVHEGIKYKDLMAQRKKRPKKNIKKGKKKKL